MRFNRLLNKLYPKSAKNQCSNSTFCEAIQRIKSIAESEENNSDAQFQYGSMFATGQGPCEYSSFTKDTEQAIYWLEKAAKQGNIDATAMLGLVYMANDEPHNAVHHYRTAAENGDAISCEELAMAYLLGDGVAKDEEEAHKWFLKAAEQGCAFSQYMIGYHYLKGKFVEENLNEAIYWLTKAAEQGVQNAQEELSKLRINSANSG